VRFKRTGGTRVAARLRSAVQRRGRRAALTALVAGSIHAAGGPSGASAAVPHVVQPGETLWSIAAANNFTTRTVAAFNGLPEDAYVVAGQTIQIPTVEEGAAALVAAGITPGSPGTEAGAGTAHVVQPGETLSGVAAANGLTTEAVAAANGRAADAWLIAGETIQIPAPGTGVVTGDPGSAASLGLVPGAAESWDAMRAEALASYGVDLQPAGPLSGYRTYEEQAYLYDLYLAGQGAPANPPGSSTHEYGIAVDLADPVMRDVVDQIGAAYGWVGTIASEWWHVEYVG
jgi:LysM repeat protein